MKENPEGRNSGRIKIKKGICCFAFISIIQGRNDGKRKYQSVYVVWHR